MVEAFKTTVSLDNWINGQAFKYAYNEKTSGFIGKKYLKERVLSAVPREFIVLGYTREKVGLRLGEMLANDLTQALIRECDERRIKSIQPEPTALGNRLNPVIGDKGVSTTGVSATNTFGTTTTGTSISNPSPASTITPGASTTAVRKFGTSISAAAAGTDLYSYFGSERGSSRGVGSQGNAPDKGKKSVIRTTESEGEDKDDGDMHEVVVFSTLEDEPNQKFLPASPVSDVDGAIANFVELSNLPKARFKSTSKPSLVDDSEDIFSRGGSSPQRSRSSSIFIPPPPILPLDVDIPFLPFKLQHRILITLQNTLESACYDFTRKHYPEFLIRKSWDCPEAGELTHWTRGLVNEFQDNPTEAIREADNFPAALKGIDEIRHSAVHRVPVSGRDIQRLIQKTNVVLHMFDATGRIRDQINELDGIIERNIHSVLDKRRKKEEILRLKLEELEKWKRILEFREAKAIKRAEYEEENIRKSFRDQVGEALGELESVEYSVGTASGPENGNASDKEETDRVEDSIPTHDEEYFHEPKEW